MRIRRSVTLFTLALAVAPGVTAQEWLTSFKPHPLCLPAISQAPAPDLPSGTARLLLRLSLMRDGSAFSGEAVFGVLPLAPYHSGGWRRLPSTTGAGRMDSLPPGRYLVRSVSIGFEPTSDTIPLAADLVTTATLHMKEILSPIRCRPPGYRLPTESACVVGPDWEIDFERKLAEEYAGPRADSTSELPPYRRADIKLVRDEAVCRQAGDAYGGPESPPRKVIVLELGQSGYMVYDPYEPLTGGEFSSRVFFDRRWRPLFGLSL